MNLLSRYRRANNPPAIRNGIFSAKTSTAIDGRAGPGDSTKILLLWIRFAPVRGGNPDILRMDVRGASNKEKGPPIQPKLLGFAFCRVLNTLLVPFFGPVGFAAPVRCESEVLPVLFP